MTEKIVIELYEIFSRRIHNIPDFEFNPSDREKKQVENFVKLLTNKYGKFSVGKTYLFNFFSFSYEYWSELDHKGKKRIPLNWIVGKKMMQRWVDRQEADLWHSSEYAISNRLHVGLIKTGSEKRVDDMRSINVSEEIEKERFYGTNLGLSICIQSTTLYNHRSKNCISCTFKTKCKKLLKDNFPKIYISRGYLKL